MLELDAINMMLRAIGSTPVNNVEIPQPDVANARRTLDRNRRSAQKRGWWFNIDYNVKYYPNFNKEIVLPEEVTSVVLNNPRLVKRGRKIYDSFNNTYRFEEPIEIHRSIRILPWDELPESMQEYVAYLSASELIRDEIEDSGKERAFKEDAGRAWLSVQKEELEASQFNAFAKGRVIRARAGVRPYSRSSRRFTGDPDA